MAFQLPCASRTTVGVSSPRATSTGVAVARSTRLIAPHRSIIAFAKGFGTDTDTDAKPQADKEVTDAANMDSAEALEARIRGARKGKKIEPKVKVNAPVAEAVNQTDAEATPEQRIETAVVLGLGYFFLLIMVEGLLLAGSGFLPEAVDQWVQDSLYPGYSPTVLLFLGCSSLYGLFKVGKLPGQKQL